MVDNTRKIVVLKDIDSPCIEQAIFILRESSSPEKNDAVAEAQKIVDRYLENLYEPAFKKKKRNFKNKFLFSAAFCFAAIVTFGAYLLSVLN